MSSRKDEMVGLFKSLISNFGSKDYNNTQDFPKMIEMFIGLLEIDLQSKKTEQEKQETQQKINGMRNLLAFLSSSGEKGQQEIFKIVESISNKSDVKEKVNENTDPQLQKLLIECVASSNFFRNTK